jgi:hypothetical protein
MTRRGLFLPPEGEKADEGRGGAKRRIPSIGGRH